MFWADKIAKDIKKRNLDLEWVDDMKTPSGKIHVGALRGVVIHDLIYKTLKDINVNSKYTYVFDNHDPMDSLPTYLDKEKFSKYMGTPLYKIPSPVAGFSNYASYYAQDFIEAFNAIGCTPEILWSTDIYESGKMNLEIENCLNKAKDIRGIYQELYEKKLPNDWFPFQIYCTKCDKVSTTQVTKWDGEYVHFECHKSRLDWAKGCGHKGKASPYSKKGFVAGKLPWKIEWAVKWKVIGITVEGAGKDHMSAGGSHDLAKLICEKITNYPVPYPLGYEFFLVGGKKMSSSKGHGSTASDMVEILPPEILRYLMIRSKLNQAINFDPSGNTIPDLFDDYQETARAYVEKSDPELSRLFELSQIDPKKPKIPPLDARFINLTQWVQMPNAKDKIKEFNMDVWVRYAKLWVERFASEEDKYMITSQIPDKALELNDDQINFLKFLIENLNKYADPDMLQKEIYSWSKEKNISSKDIFSAIYLSLLGKKYGPKAAWFLIENKDIAIERFKEVIKTPKGETIIKTKLPSLNNKKLFSIDSSISKDYPSISIGIAVIKGVEIRKEDKNLEIEKNDFLDSLKDLTTEKLSEYTEVKSYRKLYKQMGIDWHSRRPSPEALLRRVALKKGLYTVNTCVDAYNLIVMRNRVSVGAFDLDKIKFPTTLRYSKNTESIHLLGDDAPTLYKEGEIAYFDSIGGYNIDFNFRDAVRTSVNLDTKNLYINVDGIYDITSEYVLETLRESCDIIIKYCGGQLDDFGIIEAKI